MPDAFIPPHMKQAQQEAERGLAPPEMDGKSAADDPKAQEEYSFHFDWKDARGRRWKGDFRNRIITLYQRRLIGLMRARALGGVPVASVDMATLTLIHMAAWLQESLIKRPDWFSDPDKLNDDALVAAVFQEVAAHEATFHGHDTPEVPGQSTG